MTRVKRRSKNNQQRLTLATLGAVLLGICMLSYCLFQMDAFPRRRYRHNNNRGDTITNALTPDKLMADGGGNNNNNLRARAAKRREIPNEKPKGHYVTPIVQQQPPGQQQQAGQQQASSEVKKKSVPKVLGKYVLALHNGEDDALVGEVMIETRSDWAPIGAQHFDDLVAAGFYDDCRFFRVVKDFMVQFGIGAKPTLNAQWKDQLLQDDPVVETNRRGTLTYAMRGKNTRTTQLFINTATRKGGNHFLDKQGFAPFGHVVYGMEFVDQINGEYKEKPAQGKIHQKGNAYLQSEFPRLTYIRSIRKVDQFPQDEEDSDSK